MRRLLTTFVLLATLGGTAHAATEWVVILDNSTSMSQGMDITAGPDKGKKITPADPDRLAVIATLIFRAFLSPDDKITILHFDSSVHDRFVNLPANPDNIRALLFNQATYFYGPMKEAKRLLDASTLPNKKLLLVTDGAPSDERKIQDPNLECDLAATGPNPNCYELTVDEAKRVLGIDKGKPDYELISLALGYIDLVAKMQVQFLAPLGRLEQVKSATELVNTFTRIFAESIRSRPESGRIEPGGSYTFPVGKYVTEVLIAVATEKPTGKFDVRLKGAQAYNPLEQGDNGCDDKPCHTYAVFKVAHDPDSTEEMTLSLPQGGPVAYGIVLRYDLQAEIVSAPKTAKVSEEVDVVARITYKGGTFNDAAFFKADGFTAKLKLGSTEAVLTAKDDGTFAGKIAVPEPGALKLTAEFANKWITMANTRDLTAEEWMPLDLRVKPPDFGKWTGGRTATKQCIDIDLSGSVNADKVPLEVFAEGLPAGMSMAAPTTVTGNKLPKVCLTAPGCCGDLSARNTTLVIRGKHPHYHPGAAKVPMLFQVRKTPFITCWWRVLAGIAGGILLTIIIIGYVKPFDFPKEEVIRLAKTEQALARAPARRLRELPGGRRGFYRDARASLDGAGNAIGSAKGAALSLRAGKGEPVVTVLGGLEKRDPRTRKFEPVDASKGPVTLSRGVIYRCGEFFFRMG